MRAPLRPPLTGASRTAIDFSASRRPISRADADHALKEAMHAAGVRWTQRWAIYAGVRAGGAMSWRRHRRAESRGDGDG